MNQSYILNNFILSLRRELNELNNMAEWGIGNEKLGGNIVKEEFYKGQLSIINQIEGWLSVEEGFLKSKE